jgi:hypothetical protein
MIQKLKRIEGIGSNDEFFLSGRFFNRAFPNPTQLLIQYNIKPTGNDAANTMQISFYRKKGTKKKGGLKWRVVMKRHAGGACLGIKKKEPM